MTYSAELIADYATRRDYTTSPTTGVHEHAFYDPPTNGIHLCGCDMNDAAASAAIYAMPAKRARDLFSLAQSVAECGKDEGDFVVDLCIAGDMEDDFWTNRQLWPLAVAAWNAAATMEGSTDE